MDVEAGSSYQYGSGDGPNQHLAGGSKIKELQNDVDELTTVMQSNINKVLERGDRMDTLNERSELLTSRANEFRINSRNIKRKLWWQNLRFQLTMGLVFVAIVIIIIYSLSN